MSTRFRSKSFASLLLVLAWGAATAAAGGTLDKYPFPLEPQAMYDRLAGLGVVNLPPVAADEWRVLAAAWQAEHGPAAERSGAEFDRLVVDALLVASGVSTESERVAYHARLEKLVAEARHATAEAKSSYDRGEALLKFLHAGVMKSGYEAEQTSFADVFESNKHNCVSSTAMYYVVGKALGLDVKLISIPGGFLMAGHACCDLVDGDRRIEVEPTNPDGFDWVKKMNEPGVFTIGPQPDRKAGHEVDALELAAAIFSNRLASAVRAEPPRRAEAASYGIRSLMLAPCDEHIVHNAVSVFTNWGPALTEEKQFAAAVRVMKFGFQATADRDVRNNALVAYIRAIDFLLTQGEDEAASKLMAEAAQTLPDDSDVAVANCWIRFAESEFENTGEAALAAVSRGLKHVSGDDRRKLLDWRDNMLLRWSAWLMKDKKVAKSLDAVRLGMKLDPPPAKPRELLEAHTYDALVVVNEDGGGIPAAVELFQAIEREFGASDGLAEVAWSHAVRRIDALCDAGRYADAVAAAEAYAPMIADKSRGETRARPWRFWAGHLAEAKQWEAAVVKCGEGLKAVPGSELITSRALATLDDWAQAERASKGIDAAVAVYDRGLELFPDNGHLRHNREYYLEQKAAR